MLFVLGAVVEAGHPPFRLFTTEDGLVRNWVERIRRDSKGYLWLCTVEGLSLFDGYRFTNFTTQDGLPSRLVFDVTECNGEYWLGTGAGLSRLLPVAGNGGSSFETFRLGASKFANEIHTMMRDSEGNLWCGTSEGLYRVRFRGKQPQPESAPLAGGPTAVAALLEDGHGRIWVGTSNGAFVRSPGARVSRIEPKLLSPEINAMLLDRSGRLWLGVEGLMAVDPESKPPAVTAVYRYLEGKPLHVRALHQDGSGNIWIGA